MIRTYYLAKKKLLDKEEYAKQEQERQGVSETDNITSATLAPPEFHAVYNDSTSSSRPTTTTSPGSRTATHSPRSYSEYINTVRTPREASEQTETSESSQNEVSEPTESQPNPFTLTSHAKPLPGSSYPLMEYGLPMKSTEPLKPLREKDSPYDLKNESSSLKEVSGASKEGYASKSSVSTGYAPPAPVHTGGNQQETTYNTSRMKHLQIQNQLNQMSKMYNTVSSISKAYQDITLAIIKNLK